MTYSFGDVLLVPFPFTNQRMAKKRPAIVVSSDRYNQQHIDLILMAVTSQTGSLTYTDNLVIHSWQQAGLLKPSVIKPIIMTAESNLILKKLGTLTLSDQQALQKLISQILGLSQPC
jgi:mRNA interferase MazF